MEIIEPLTSKMERVYTEAEKKRKANVQAKQRELAKRRKIAASKIELAAKYSRNKQDKLTETKTLAKTIT